LRAGVGTLARCPQGGGPARSVDPYPNAILFTAVPTYDWRNGAAVHSVLSESEEYSSDEPSSDSSDPQMSKNAYRPGTLSVEFTQL
jgi:hypothetical protein